MFKKHTNFFQKVIFSVLILGQLISANFILAKSQTVTLYFFYGQGCPHCAKEELFLDELQEKYPHLEIKKFEVWSDKGNAKLLKEMAREYNLEASAVPVTFINEKGFVGYLSDETTGSQIEAIVKEKIQGAVAWEPAQKTVRYPFLGSINLFSLSLPVLTLVLGTLDGFNPCAMWVLMFLLALLINTRSRRKMWLFGGTFILTSGVVYYIFMAAWLNLFLFIGFVEIIRLVVGILAIMVGVIYLRDFITHKAGQCKVKGSVKVKLMEKIQKAIEGKMLLTALLGIVILAFLINLIEFFCSAGLPALYTGILSLSNLSTLGYYLYLLFYVIIFILDDLIVFAIALVTLSAVGFRGKYARFVNLFGALLILVLGILLLLRPEVLMLG